MGAVLVSGCLLFYDLCICEDQTEGVFWRRFSSRRWLQTKCLLSMMCCRSLIKLDNITSPLDILEHYPRDYQYCFPRMYDNEYASVVGTIVKHTSFNNYKFQKTELVVRVDPHACAELDPLSADIPPGQLPSPLSQSCA